MIYYCIGIKGSGMSTLANCLYDLGNEVIGYDDHKDYKFTEEGLNKRNISIKYAASDIPKDAIVTYSKAFSKDHPEIKRMIDNGYKIIDYNEVVGKITAIFKTIAVNGTHGKTTISTMVSKILNDTIGCNYYIGDGSAKIEKDKEYLVIEADEYNKHFLAYHPYISITSNIEEDHLECYPKGLSEIIKTFEIFNNKANLSIINGDDYNINKMNFNHKVRSFGLNENNDVYASNYQTNQLGMSFDCYINNNLYGHFDLPFYGLHMLYNSLATIALCEHLNIAFKDVLNSLKKFVSAHRRFKIEELSDNIIIDDYAHHPSEISTTIKAIKQKYPKHEIVVVFMPNTYSRTQDLFNDFVTSLSLADYVYITPINSNREKQEEYPNINSDKLVASIKDAKLIDLKDISKLNKHHHSVVAFMSCADISKFINSYRKEQTKG